MGQNHELYNHLPEILNTFDNLVNEIIHRKSNRDKKTRNKNICKQIRTIDITQDRIMNYTIIYQITFLSAYALKFYN